MSLDVNLEPEEFNSAELHDSIKEVARLKGIEDFEYQVEFACEKNESYVANIFRVFINSREKEKNISVIVKTLINTTRQELFSELHKREVFVYNEVIPKFNAIQKNIHEDDKVVLPECLLSIVDKGKEVIILEDLSLKKYAMEIKIGKFEKLDYLQVRLVLTELAKFHGLSFILAKKDPETFAKLISELQDIMFEETFLTKSKLKTYYSDSYSASLKVITDEDVREKLELIEPKLLHLLRKYVAPRKINVLCHGDCWINNLLFKHQEGKQSQLCFIDFQAMRYANPVSDLLYFIYLCTDFNFRNEYFDILQTVYYESLKYFLNIFGLDIKDFYPKDDFMNDLKDSLPFGLLAAMIDMKIVTNDDTDTINLLTTDENENTDINDQSTNRLFCVRINDVVKEFADNGVLDKLVEEIKE